MLQEERATDHTAYSAAAALPFSEVGDRVS